MGEQTEAAKIRERIARQKLARVRALRATKAQASLAAAHAAKPVERFHQRMARLKTAAKHHHPAPVGRWCILRTSRARTLPLAESLVQAGFDAWTPVEEAERRSGRSRAREYVDAPMMPGFVFAREEHIRELLGIIGMHSSPHPSFSIFVHAGRAPLIGDRSMDELRRLETLAIRKLEDRAKARNSRVRRDLAIGSTVKVKEDGNFLGMVGVVEACDGRSAMINFGGKQSFKIDTWRLLEDALLTVSEAA
ncbi:transcription termination/antitermination NusG family protein [Sphingomonas sp. MMS24-J13]|uniref:transcription termination/antitermination NusG family protein n=1 Tax=Sphingomonas sp. MMS24-J13 TaxID=3238686 RepID=UPI00384B6AB5